MAHPAGCSYAELPPELVQRIFAQAGDHCRALLSVQDRCATFRSFEGQAVCACSLAVVQPTLASTQPRSLTLLSVLGWRCRLRAVATCRAWRQALRGLPFQTLHLGGHGAGDKAKQWWAVLALPAATEVILWQTTKLSARALRSLDRKVCNPMAGAAPPALPGARLSPGLVLMLLDLSNPLSPGRCRPGSSCRCTAKQTKTRVPPAPRQAAQPVVPQRT